MAMLVLAVKTADAVPLPGRLTVPAGETPLESLRRARETRASRDVNASATRAQVASLPRITGGSVSPKPVQAADPLSLPSLQFSFTAPFGLAFAEFDFASPNGVQSFSTAYNLAALPRHGRIAFSALVGLPVYAAAGAWPLAKALLVDGAGSVTAYTGHQLAGLMNGAVINVVNQGTIDDKPPTLLGGQVLTPIVHTGGGSPYFAAEVTASDAGSGYYVAYVFVQAPGANFSFADFTPLTAPAPQGNARNVTSLAGAPSGTWTIAGYMVCDAADNCVSTNSLTDVRDLFGTTTFTVTE